MNTLNHDVFGMVNRIRRFKFEWAKSQSSNASYVSPADSDRLKDYLEALMKYKKWFQDQPLLDLPESSPREMELGVAEALPRPENEAIADVMNMWDLLEHELVHSQSSRMPCRLIGHDEKRVDSILQKMSNFLADYISDVQPLDLPESSPLRGSTGLGRKGLGLGK